MDIMNLIHEICLTVSAINNTPKWKFITRNKLKNKLDEKISEFKELNIFDASDNMLSFLLSLDKELIIYIIRYRNLYYDATFIGVNLKSGYNASGTIVLYHPKLNRFDITGSNMSYSIHRKDRLGKRTSSIWEPLTYRIKERYIEIIIDIAKIL